MISVDNFYYILYKNLLEPASLSVHYFYPFGSTENENLKYMWPKVDSLIHQLPNHTVLFYDQEPLLKESLPYITPILNSFSTCKLLANSEHSAIKKKICKQECFLDWYYFYHGFASLFWFSDYKYMNKVENQFTKVFISLNRLHTNLRSYRLNLVNEYVKQDILQYGLVSLPLNENYYGSWRDEINDPNTLLPKHKLSEIKQNLSNLSPLVVDEPNPQGSLSAECGGKALRLNQSALWYVVSETIFYDEKLHLTEKIFKPITSRRPFILVGAVNNLEYLRSYGFQTFDKWIDESYDKESDPDKRISMIVTELAKLSKLNQNQLRDMHQEMKPVLEYNFEHFYNNFKNIIVDELLENFKTCINVYNNNRYDRQNINTNKIDFPSIRNLFLR